MTDIALPSSIPGDILSSDPPAYTLPPPYSTPLPPPYSALPSIKASSSFTHREEVLLFSAPPSSVVSEDGKWFFDVQTRPGRRRKRIITTPHGKPLLSIYATPEGWLIRDKNTTHLVNRTVDGLKVVGENLISVSGGQMVREGQVLGTVEMRNHTVSVTFGVTEPQCKVTVAPGYDLALAVALGICQIDGRAGVRKWWQLL